MVDDILHGKPPAVLRLARLGFVMVPLRAEPGSPVSRCGAGRRVFAGGLAAGPGSDFTMGWFCVCSVR
jgi:hypothetical protein